MGLSLRCDRRAPRLARRAIEDALEDGLALRPVLDDAKLVASELVNDAVLHPGRADDEIIRVAAELDDGFLIISVDGPGHAPELLERGAEDEPEPRRLARRVLEQIADRWGAERTDRHRVWVSLPVGRT